MRPPLLNPLFAPLTTLPGVGTFLAQRLDRLLQESGQPARLLDLLFHLPHTAIERQVCTIREAKPGTDVLLKVKVVEHCPPKRGSRLPYKILVEDHTSSMFVTFFSKNSRWLEQSMPLGSHRWLAGKIELWNYHAQMSHPDHILDEKTRARLRTVEPIYRLTEGVSSWMVGRLMGQALQRIPQLPEWIAPQMLQKEHFPSFQEALVALHHPAALALLDPQQPAARRLAYDELFANQCALLLARRQLASKEGRSSVGKGELYAKLLSEIPFLLTQSQKQAIQTIHEDLASLKPMLRLLQGDVGSGKTIVAFASMMPVVESGGQAALMVPTELLARQHFAHFLPLAEKLNLRLAILAGREKISLRKKIHAQLAEGEIDILIGTHALLQEKVHFKDLAFVAIDEQHRFGVAQRLNLTQKGVSVDRLIMTATPIPRTLRLAYCGDMDVSILSDKPPGRLPILTRMVALERLEEVVQALMRALKKGSRAYWVCPLVEENEELALSAVSIRFAFLREYFGTEVSCVHGKLKGDLKEEELGKFYRGETKILVATSIIEVGIDVPEANIIVIEHAERFGLAQLHQLRGRVGRGESASTCLLLYKTPLNEIARARLATIRDTEDGFRIAEADLMLRGEGEILGTRQSGAPLFRLAKPLHQDALLPLARAAAEEICHHDPQLSTPRGQAVRLLLHLFDRTQGIIFT